MPAAPVTRQYRVSRVDVAGIILVINSVLVGGGQYGSAYNAKKAAGKANAKLAQHQALTEDEVSDLNKWHDTQDKWRMRDKTKFEGIAAMQKGYWKAQGHNAKDVLLGQLKGAYFGFGDWVGRMLLGMALYKNGFLSGHVRAHLNPRMRWSQSATACLSTPLLNSESC